MFDKQRYESRNLVERFFCRIKPFRRIATRYDKLVQRFSSYVAFAASVAGPATVAVFHDVNTGNTTCMAAQRSATVVSVAPILQGLRKPGNELSRGALVCDIVFTIALTANQAQRIPQHGGIANA